jgi:hypothetical protein
VATGLIVLCGGVVMRAAAAPVDTTPPSVTVRVTGTQGKDGWYISDTWVIWTITEPESLYSEDGCDNRLVSQDTTGVEFKCTATNAAGLSSPPLTVEVKLDKTPPTVAMVRRAPDANGWYNHTLNIRPTAVDAISGQGTCTAPIRYRGPNRARVKVKARCTNGAGLASRRTLRFKYDGTKPSIRVVPGRAPDRYGWYARPVRIRFAGKDALSRMDRCSSQVYGRPNTARASVTGWCRDRAGNTRTRTFRFRFSSPLLEPRKGMRVSSPPLLDWVGVPRARGYNVQLWHDGRKILSRWPTASQMQLDRRWSYQSRNSRLARGESYTWYVWPRFRHGYGKMLGSSRFAFVQGS